MELVQTNRFGIVNLVQNGEFLGAFLCKVHKEPIKGCDARPQPYETIIYLLYCSVYIYSPMLCMYIIYLSMYSMCVLCAICSLCVCVLSIYLSMCILSTCLCTMYMCCLSMYVVYVCVYYLHEGVLLILCVC